jgi:hypothetical protein
VQLWFGEFIHAVMEEGFDRWNAAAGYKRLPWNRRRIRDIELTIHHRLAARGLLAPRQLFCPADDAGQGCVNPGNCDHQLLASRRAEAMLTEWAPSIYPLIAKAEVRLRHLRVLPNDPTRRYEVTGIIDVLGSVEIDAANEKNRLVQRLRSDPPTRRLLDFVTGTSYEVVLDYKGMRRPTQASGELERFVWQVLTYAWLRAHQPDSAPVVAGILLFVNELEPSQTDLRALRQELISGELDVEPLEEDRNRLIAWNGRSPAPTLSPAYRAERCALVVRVDDQQIGYALSRFDLTVADIEEAIDREAAGRSVVEAWRSRGSREPFTAPIAATCTACDFQTYCPSARDAGLGRVPRRP